MTENKRFRHMRNRLGMQFIGYDEKYVLLGTFADAEGVKYIVDLLNQLNDENEQLKTFKSKVFKLIDDSIKIYEDTTTNDEFLQIQLDTKLQTLYNLRKELQE